MTDSLKKIIHIIVSVAKPDKIILFGSRSNGLVDEHSDYDVLVLKNGVKQHRKLCQKIYLNFKNIGAPVDVIVEDMDKYEQLKNDPYLIYSEAAKHGRVVYAKH